MLNNKKAGQIQKVSAVPLSKRSLKFATLHANNKVRKSFTKMKENNIALNDVQVERHVSF